MQNLSYICKLIAIQLLEMSDSRHKDNVPTLSEFSSELRLFNEDLFDFQVQGDLYDELIKEPILVKNDSIKYEYAPNFFSNQLIEREANKETETDDLKLHQKSKSVTTEMEKIIKCNCSKTKCQKNYCDCFKAGRACTAACSCINCCNDELTRMNLPKKGNGTGCKCQKSHCKKNYCECHSAGKKCTEECNCVQCHNTVQYSVHQGLLERDPTLLKETLYPKKKVKKDLQHQTALIEN